MLAQIVVILVLLVSATACSAIAYFMVPSSRHTFSYGGTDRSYRLYQPEGLAKQSPLVVVLHALGANTVNAEQSMGWDKQADQGRFAVVYPEGIGWTWNANGCCGEAGQKGTDDVGFITAVIGRVPDIDRSRIYVTGFSNGGLMAYTLACTTDIFAAIGPVAATQVDPCRSPHPTSVMAYHNLDDPTVRFGGTPKGGPFLVDGPPVAEVIERWRRIDECGPPVETVVGPRTTSTAMCADNREVALITNADGGHAWPKNFETGLWKFFARHAK